MVLFNLPYPGESILTNYKTCSNYSSGSYYHCRVYTKVINMAVFYFPSSTNVMQVPFNSNHIRRLTKAKELDKLTYTIYVVKD